MNSIFKNSYLAETGFKQLSRSESCDKPKTAEEIIESFNRFKIKEYAVLVDHTTIEEDLPKLDKFKFAGFFSFDITRIGKEIGKEKIILLSLDKKPPEVNGWILGSASRPAVFALNKLLMENKREDQIIIRLYSGQTTDIEAYADFFSGETESIFHFHHYFTKKYGINFPIDLRYTVYDSEGLVKKSGQIIIPPDGIRIIKSTEMNMGPFQGHMKIELEVENLQARVQPFIHLYIRYISEAGICCNHQAGLGVIKKGAIFCKCPYPLEKDVEMTCSILNTNKIEITPQAILVFKKDGKEIQIVREMRKIKPGITSYQNVCELFSDINFEGVNNAQVLFKNDAPIRRPNHYFHPKGTKQYFNFDHQAAIQPKEIFKNRELFEKFGIEPFLLPVPMFPKEFEIESYMGLIYPTVCNSEDFRFIFRDENGKEIFSKNEKLNESTPQFINLNRYAQKENIEMSAGSFNLLPEKGYNNLTETMQFLLGFKHKNATFCCFQARGVQHHNLPFYVSRILPHYFRYDYSPVQASELYGIGIVSKEYDTLFISGNWSLYKDYSKICNYQIEIIDGEGRTYSIPRTIKPQSHDSFWLSDLIKDLKIKNSENYSVWAKSYDTLLFAMSIILRKQDCATSVVDMFEATLMHQVPIYDDPGVKKKMSESFRSFFFRNILMRLYSFDERLNRPVLKDGKKSMEGPLKYGLKSLLKAAFFIAFKIERGMALQRRK